MRIWSVHPKYLDAKGLVALWRESLLAKNVLLGNTKGYKNHPQLNRFKESDNPLGHINYYLEVVWHEATSRAYNFDKSKFEKFTDIKQINLTDGQLSYERLHLLKKLEQRDYKKYEQFKNEKPFEPHPLFKLTKGDIADWEKF